MDFLNLAKKRCSVREYQDRKVEQEKLDAILEAGRVAPTATNAQPVRVLAVRGEQAMKRLGRAANVYHAPLALVVCADRDRAWTRPFDGRQSAEIDASIVTDHMMLEATQQGLGSVWICYFKPDVLREAFQLPESWEPVNILAVGYPAAPLASPDRHDQTRIPAGEFAMYVDD